MIEQLFDAFIPHRCCSCGEIGQILCDSCAYDITEDAFDNCLFCLKPSLKNGICDKCRRVYRIDQAWCVGYRERALKTLLDEYKFDSRRSASACLASLLDEVIPMLPEGCAVVGVPSTPSKIRQRGFDHIKLFAEGLAKLRGLPYLQPLVRESRESLHFLSRKDRIKLGPSLFSLRRGVEIPDEVLLVDDIVTTGTTMKAAVKLLRKAGVQNVYAVAVARQPENK